MFGTEVGSQVAWLLPAALVLGVAGLWFARGRAHRPVRAGLTLWLGWLLVTGLTFSFMAGIFHPYYTVALAPAIGALVGIGALRALAAPRLAGRRAASSALHHRAHHRASPSSCSPATRRTGTRGCKYVVAVVGLRRRADARRGAAPAAAGRDGGRRGGAGRRAGRPRGVLPRDRGHPAHRLDPERRARRRAAVAGPRRQRPTGPAAARRRHGAGGTAPAPAGTGTGGAAPAACSTAARRARR